VDHATPTAECIQAVWLGQVPYGPTYDAMQAFTRTRDADSADQLWLCEHPATYTQGLAGRPDHVLSAGEVPVVQTDRGGQVTFHGPGQVVAYPLLDLRRRGYFVKEYVYRLEESVIRTLAAFGVTGHRVAGAPGIYVVLEAPGGHAPLPQRPQRGQTQQPANAFAGLGKIAALGIKVSRHCTYHGASLNVDMDLKPFLNINPCGYAGLQTVDLSTIGVRASVQDVAGLWAVELQRLLAP
jgi:lipoyl(octanoyl) transferase